MGSELRLSDHERAIVVEALQTYYCLYSQHSHKDIKGVGRVDFRQLPQLIDRFRAKEESDGR